MSFLSSIFKNGAEGLLNGAKGIIEQFHLSPEDKVKANLEMEKLIYSQFLEVENTYRMEIESKTDIIKTELTQDDLYTKRTRPFLLRMGFYVIVIIHAALPLLFYYFPSSDNPPPVIVLPELFWVTWGGLGGMYFWGRSQEKVAGIANSKGVK